MSPIVIIYLASVFTAIIGGGCFGFYLGQQYTLWQARKSKHEARMDAALAEIARTRLPHERFLTPDEFRKVHATTPETTND